MTLCGSCLAMFLDYLYAASEKKVSFIYNIFGYCCTPAEVERRERLAACRAHFSVQDNIGLNLDTLNRSTNTLVRDTAMFPPLDKAAAPTVAGMCFAAWMADIEPAVR